MWFYRFICACYKYRFTYILGTYGKTELILRPNDTFTNITIRVDPYKYRELFKKAILEMKRYRAENH